LLGLLNEPTLVMIRFTL